uniref:Uncharacterized protein n=1 Tax=Periophthalmus magnuspinnatus TaxID=409849 RepID=A0A3B4AT72_9GOBI
DPVGRGVITDKDPSDCSLSESFTAPSCTLGVDLRRGRRRFSGNLQLPPLSWRQGERSRTPDDEVMTRPTSLPFGAPPRIDITPEVLHCVFKLDAPSLESFGSFQPWNCQSVLNKKKKNSC